MYRKNNIQFRVVSSLSKSQFLQAQHYYLKLMYDNPDQFNSYIREIVLLNYEVWFKFITRLERFFIFSSNKMDSEYILAEFRTSYIEMQDIIRTNPEVFYYNENNIAVFKKTTDIFFSVFRRLLDSFNNHNIDSIEAYPSIVKMLSLHVQNNIHIVYELDSIDRKSEAPFLSITDFAIETLQYDICCIFERAKLYKEYFNISEFKIKNYLNTEIPSQCLDNFNDSGIVISSIE